MGSKSKSKGKNRSKKSAKSQPKPAPTTQPEEATPQDAPTEAANAPTEVANEAPKTTTERSYDEPKEAPSEPVEAEQVSAQPTQPIEPAEEPNPPMKSVEKEPLLEPKKPNVEEPTKSSVEEPDSAVLENTDETSPLLESGDDDPENNFYEKLQQEPEEDDFYKGLSAASKNIEEECDDPTKLEKQQIVDDASGLDAEIHDEQHQTQGFNSNQLDADTDEPQQNEEDEFYKGLSAASKNIEEECDDPSKLAKQHVVDDATGLDTEVCVEEHQTEGFDGNQLDADNEEPQQTGEDEFYRGLSAASENIVEECDEPPEKQHIVDDASGLDAEVSIEEHQTQGFNGNQLDADTEEPQEDGEDEFYLGLSAASKSIQPSKRVPVSDETALDAELLVEHQLSMGFSTNQLDIDDDEGDFYSQLAKESVTESDDFYERLPSEPHPEQPKEPEREPEREPEQEPKQEQEPEQDPKQEQESEQAEPAEDDDFYKALADPDSAPAPAPAPAPEPAPEPVPEPVPAAPAALVDLDLDDDDDFLEDTEPPQQQPQVDLSRLSFLESDEDLLPEDEEPDTFEQQLNEREPEPKQSSDLAQSLNYKPSIPEFHTEKQGFDLPLEILPTRKARHHAPRVVSRTATPIGPPDLHSATQSPSAPPVSHSAPPPSRPPQRAISRTQRAGSGSASKYAPSASNSPTVPPPSAASQVAGGFPPVVPPVISTAAASLASSEPVSQAPAPAPAPVPSVSSGQRAREPQRPANPDPFGFPGLQVEPQRRAARATHTVISPSVPRAPSNSGARVTAGPPPPAGPPPTGGAPPPPGYARRTSSRAARIPSNQSKGAPQRQPQQVPQQPQHPQQVPQPMQMPQLPQQMQMAQVPPQAQLPQQPQQGPQQAPQQLQFPHIPQQPQQFPPQPQQQQQQQPQPSQYNMAPTMAPPGAVSAAVSPRAQPPSQQPYSAAPAPPPPQVFAPEPDSLLSGGLQPPIRTGSVDEFAQTPSTQYVLDPPAAWGGANGDDSQHFPDRFVIPECAGKLPLPLLGPKGPAKNKKKELEKWIDERVEEQGALPGTLLYKLLKQLVSADADSRTRSVLNVLHEYKSNLRLETAALPDAPHTSADSVSAIFNRLAEGDRENSLKSALDSHSFAHALVLARSVSAEQWQIAVEEFIAQEVRVAAPPLAFIYRSLAAETPEAGQLAIQELKPRGETTLLDEAKVDSYLVHWASYVSALYDAAKPATVETIKELGKLLVQRGLVEEGQACFVLAGVPLGSIPEFKFPLVAKADNHEDTPVFDSYVLAEIYEFWLGRGTPALLPQKLAFAGLLADGGYSNEGLRVAETIAQVLKSTKNAPPQLVEAANAMVDRCASTATAPSGGWLQRKLSRPNLEKKWVSSFNKFVSGEDDDAEGSTPPADAAAKAPNQGDVPGGAMLQRPLSATTSGAVLAQGPAGFEFMPPPQRQSATPGPDWRSDSPGLSPSHLRPKSSTAPRPAPLAEVDEEEHSPYSSQAYPPQHQQQQYQQPYAQAVTPVTVPPQFVSPGQYSPYQTGAQQPQQDPQQVPQPQQQYQLQPQQQYQPQPQQQYQPQPQLQYQQYQPQQQFQQQPQQFQVPQQPQLQPQQYSANGYSPQPEPQQPEPQAKPGPEPAPAPEPESEPQQTESKGKQEKDDGSKKKGWFSWLKKEDSNAPKPIEVKLGSNTQMYFDKELGRWVQKGGPKPEPKKGPPPPPKAASLPATSSASTPGAAPVPAASTPNAASTRPAPPGPSGPSGPLSAAPSASPSPAPGVPPVAPSAGIDGILAAASAGRGKRRPARSRYVGTTASGMPEGLK